jgi:tRNA 2-thiocytidine biosynthesis protein TtcA
MNEKGGPPDPASVLEEALSRALGRWRMLAGVRRLAVGVSGGADSLALLSGLASTIDPAVEIVAVHINQHPKHQDADRLVEYVTETFGLRTHVVTADTSVEAERMVGLGKAPCRACAPVRARRLGRAAKELNADALALGHHLDDAVATLLMNMFHRGQVETMRPVARRRSHPTVPLLRPMLFVTERAVKAASPVDAAGLFDCGMCTVHAQERARVGRFVAEMFDTHDPAPKFLGDLLASIASGAAPTVPNGGSSSP